MHVNDLPGYDPKNPHVAHDDEKCFGVLETELWTENDKGQRVVHRFQIIDFLRGNTRLKEVRDLNVLGLYSNLNPGMPYRQIANLQHSVGECKMFADEFRVRGIARVREMTLEQKESTLINDAIERAEIVQKVLKRASHFGSRVGGRTSGTQRN